MGYVIYLTYHLILEGLSILDVGLVKVNRLCYLNSVYIVIMITNLYGSNI